MNQQGVSNSLNDIVDLMLGFLHVSLFTLSVHFCSIFSKYTVLDKDFQNKIVITRKYPLYGYIQGVIMQKTIWDRNLGGEKTLKCV